MYECRSGAAVLNSVDYNLLTTGQDQTNMSSDPAYNFGEIQQCCYLTFPDRNNYNEFLRLCPVHGCLSKPCVQKEVSCLEKCLLHCQSKSPHNLYQIENGLPKALDSVGDYLKHIHNCNFTYPRPKPGNPGSAADPFDKRIKALQVDCMVSRPKSPVVKETFSFRSRRPGEVGMTKPIFLKGVRSQAYRYCRDLGLVDEAARLFIAELRHTFPEGYVERPTWQRVTLFFRPNTLEHLRLRALPGDKYFVCGIRYQDFSTPVDLHFGDQVVEIMPIWMQEQIKEAPRQQSHADNKDGFQVIIVPSPFLRKIQLRVYDCPIINEFNIKKKTIENTRSHRDLGFTIHRGRIVYIDKASPANMSGFEPDYQIVEVAGESVLEHDDSHIIRLIRTAIGRSSARAVELAVIPSRFFDLLMDPRKGKVCTIVRDAEFDVNAWSDNKVFGVRSGNGKQRRKINLN
ncbi:Syntenin-2 [Taenia solium]|eukprot:TsM_000699400 transcript=TsM_000699400 gene=TsM_000699400